MTTQGIDPAADELRLDALVRHDVLDTAPERGFDDIVALACQLCDTPVALVSLVDRHRQWFKARVGFEPSETDLNSSVCRHALGRSDILEISDLTRDPRTQANPLVTGEPFIRFYAGAPLNTAEGHTLGTLCVIDKSPRPGGLTDAQRAPLRTLANQVMSQLDLRRAVDEQRESRAVAIAEAARLEAMIATQQAVASAEADLSAVFQAVVDGALRVIDAADGAVVELRSGDDIVYDTVSGSSAGHKGIRFPIGRTMSGRAVLTERPMVCADTQTDTAMNHALAIGLGIRSMVVVPVTRRGEPIGALKVQSARPDAFSPRDVVMTQMLAGLVASAFGDVAEAKSQRALRRAETRYRQTFESVTEFGVVVTDRDGTVTDWNAGAERIFGWSAEEMRGVDAERFFTPEDRRIDRLGVEMASSLSDGRATDERWHLKADGSRFYASGNMMPLRDDEGEHIGFIKIVRDRTEQHLAGVELEASRRALEASEAKWRGVFEDLQEGFILGQVVRDATGRIVDWRYEEVNRAWGELVGIPSSQAAGRTIRELFPGIEDAWVNEFATVVETGETIRFTRQVGTLQRWYDGVCQPAGGDRFVVIFLEVTERVRGERRAEALRELGDALLTFDEPAAMSAAAEAILGRALGVGRVGYGTVAVDGETFTVPNDWTAPGYPTLAGTYRMDDYGGYAEDLRRGRTVVIPDIRLDPRTSADTGPLESVAVRALINLPIVEAGRTVAILYVNADEPRDWTAEEVAFVGDVASRVRVATERRRAEAVLRDSRQQLLVERGLLQAVVRQAPLGISITFADGRAEMNARMEEMTGRGFGAASDERYRDFGALHADGRPYAVEDYPTVRSLRGGEMVAAEPMTFRNGRTGEVRRWEVSSTPVLGPEGETLASVTVAIDVEDRLREEERRGVLNGEIAHRLKNNLALVQSIATQTLRTAPDVASARQTLSERIGALSKAHDILMIGQRDAAPIADIVRSATALHDPGGRIRTSGPDDVRLGPKASLTLSLVLHELSTNAVKYGALSVEGGSVAVEWSVAPDAATGRPVLRFEWQERGGPPVAEPTRKSFGTRLIGMGLSGTAAGTSQLTYAPEGVRCALTGELTELQATDDA